MKNAAAQVVNDVGLDTGLISELKNIAGRENVICGEPMALHTTFRIGGPADAFVIPAEQDAVAPLVQTCRAAGVPLFILGNGSNLLVSDSGYRGVIIQIDKNLQNVHTEGNVITAEAGAHLSKLAAAAQNNSLAGFEFASGIPGTLGGACAMNAGAYGGEMKDVLSWVRVSDEDGNIQQVPAEKLDLGYRRSRIMREHWIVLSARIELKAGDPETIAARMEELRQARRSKQPLEYPSAGSTFKRPEGYFAGKLIADAGLKGFSVGDAQVSEKHCGFVINRGHASAEDVVSLIRYIQDTVFDRFGVRLEPEVRFLGF